MRYVDLVVNPQVRDAFVKRTRLVNSMRSYLNNKGIPGGGNADSSAPCMVARPHGL